jgi:hypothetical protein
MSLKRKAEIAAVPSSPSIPAPSEWASMIDGNNHLHSRTRKRFRDDRPSDQVIYRTCFFLAPICHPLIALSFDLADRPQRTHYAGSFLPRSSKCKCLHVRSKWIQWTQNPLSKHPRRLTRGSKHYTGSSNQHPSNHLPSDHPVKHLRLAQMRQLWPRRTVFGVGRLTG